MVNISKPVLHSERAAKRFAQSSGFFTESTKDESPRKVSNHEMIGDLSAYGWNEESNRSLSHPDMQEFHITLENGAARLFNDGVFLGEFDSASAAHDACLRHRR